MVTSSFSKIKLSVFTFYINSSKNSIGIKIIASGTFDNFFYFIIGHHAIPFL